MISTGDSPFQCTKNEPKGKENRVETIVINKDKIKIMLDSIDMEKYCPEDVFSNESDKAEAAIWQILDKVAETTDFDTEKSSFYVQIYPSKSGGCEMFITRIRIPEIGTAVKGCQGSGKLQKEDTGGMKYIYENEENLMAYGNETCKAPKLKSPTGTFIYRFDDFETLLKVCREISLSSAGGESEAYYDAVDGCCYLILENDSYHALEFGGQRRAKKEKYYIAEHCKPICTGAVERLKSYAV